jgi:uncharacterized protein
MTEFTSDSSTDYAYQEHTPRPKANMGNDMTFHSDGSRRDTLRKFRSAESIIIPRDVFEKLYLSPQQPAAGHYRKTFGSPTPVALVGFLLLVTPNACALMGWRGADGGGDAIR